MIDPTQLAGALEAFRTEVDRVVATQTVMQGEITRIGTLQTERRETDKDWRDEITESLHRLEQTMADHTKANGNNHLLSSGAVSVGGGGMVAALFILARVLGWL